MWGATLVLAAASCAKKSGAPSVSAEGAYAPAPAGDDIAAYEQQLAMAEADLRRLGVNAVSFARPGGGEASGVGADAGSSPPTDAPAAEDAADGDAGEDDFEAEESIPLEPSPAAPAANAPRNRDAVTEQRKSERFSRREQKDRCESICDVADSVCTLEGKICSLAAAHAGDARYQDACTRASDDCEVGEEACRACQS